MANFADTKQNYIRAWGTLGTSWGINKAMAQIHALLLVSPSPLSTDQIMDELGISRGNANMNLRGLIDWGIIYKTYKQGDRKEYFIAEKDVWKAAKHIMQERKKKELDPAVEMLNNVKEITPNKDDKEEEEFKKVTTELARFANKSDEVLQMFIKAEENWLFRTFLKFVK